MWPQKLGGLSTHVFETRTATGSEHFACWELGNCTIVYWGKILSNVNAVV